eukprot:8009597-Lingulodinium_polyedra.AAC.1
MTGGPFARGVALTIARPVWARPPRGSSVAFRAASSPGGGPGAGPQARIGRLRSPPSRGAGAVQPGAR